MIYMEYKYAYPDENGIASFGTCNVSMENHLDKFDIRPGMANIVDVEPDRIVILDQKMIDVSSMETLINTYQVTPGLLNRIAWLLIDSNPSKETKVVVGRVAWRNAEDDFYKRPCRRLVQG